MEHTNESILVKLADLVPSPFNVRRHSRTSVEELAALIDSQGLLHPLTVNEHLVGKGKEATGKATDDEQLEAEGKVDQTKSDLKQAGEKVKDAFKN